MSGSSLFAHIVGSFSVSTENIATEALHFIISRHSAARGAFVEFGQALGVDLSQHLHFRTQKMYEDGTIPDLVGLRSDGTRQVIGEMKFWAGLTDKQPVEYLKLLPDDYGGLLLLVAPRSRLRALWSQCERRIAEDERLSFTSETETGVDSISARLGPHMIAVVSWGRLLSFLHRKLALADDPSALSDLRQLKGLVDRIEREGFIPFHSDDLAPERGRKQLQLVQLVGDVMNELVAQNLVSTDRYGLGGRNGTYGRFCGIAGFEAFLAFSPRVWSQTNETPLWLVIRSSKERHGDQARELLSHLSVESPQKVFFLKETESHIPLYVPTGLERKEVVEDLVQQVKDIVDLLTPDSPISENTSTSKGPLSMSPNEISSPGG